MNEICLVVHLPKNSANLYNGYSLSTASRKTDFHRISVNSTYFGAQSQVPIEPSQAMIGSTNHYPGGSNWTTHQPPYNLGQEMRARD